MYEFTGSYSTVARAVPFSIASSIDASSLRVDVLTSGYTVSKYISPQQDSNFLVANLYPATPMSVTTRITLRFSYSAFGPIRISGVSFLLFSNVNNNFITRIIMLPLITTRKVHPLVH